MPIHQGPAPGYKDVSPNSLTCLGQVSKRRDTSLDQTVIGATVIEIGVGTITDEITTVDGIGMTTVVTVGAVTAVEEVTRVIVTEAETEIEAVIEVVVNATGVGIESCTVKARPSMTQSTKSMSSKRAFKNSRIEWTRNWLMSR